LQRARGDQRIGLTLELLYVAPRLVDGRFKSARVRFEALASGCRTAPAQSLMLTDEWAFTRDGRRTLRFAKRELDKLCVVPGAEFTADACNLKKLTPPER
jgi:hypothetical protein